MSGHGRTWPDRVWTETALRSEAICSSLPRCLDNDGATSGHRRLSNRHISLLTGWTLSRHNLPPHRVHRSSPMLLSIVCPAKRRPRVVNPSFWRHDHGRRRYLLALRSSMPAAQHWPFAENFRSVSKNPPSSPHNYAMSSTDYWIQVNCSLYL